MSGVRGRAGDYFVTRLSEHEWSGGGGEEKGMGDWTAALLRGMDAARSELVDWGMAC